MKETPHISIKEIGFSKTVLMPGDPMRAERVARRFLTDVTVISDVRGIKAYRGLYRSDIKGDSVDVTVMASGMGMPSMGIYSHELFRFFDVESIIRIGSIGGVNRNLKLGDMIVAQAASTNSNYMAQFGLTGYHYAPIGDFELIGRLKGAAEKLCGADNRVYVGNVLSSDTFYGAQSPDWNAVGVLGIEMEAAALFAEAAAAGKKAGCICTVSDLVFDKTKTMTAEERQNSLDVMIQSALEAAV